MTAGSIATIIPLSDGTAIWLLNGIEHPFPSWQAAAEECDARRVQWRLERFPDLSVAVITTSPALTPS